MTKGKGSFAEGDGRHEDRSKGGQASPTKFTAGNGRIEERQAGGRTRAAQPSAAEARALGGHVAATARARAAERWVSEEEALSPPETLEDVAKWLTWIAHAVAIGKIDYRTGDAIVRSLRELRPTLESIDIARKVAELEERLEQQGGGR